MGFTQEQKGFWLAEQVPQKTGLWMHVVELPENARHLKDILRFCAPELRVIDFPAWNCLPYDRLSPSKEVLGERIRALEQLRTGDTPCILLVTPQALMQKISVASAQGTTAESFTYRVGDCVSREKLLQQLQYLGFERQEVVREPGEFAIRGSLLDVYLGYTGHPFRLDFFGETLEQIKIFDPLSQRTVGQTDELTLTRLSECLLIPESLERFKSRYRAAFPQINCLMDPLYQALMQGRTYPGMEHWLPLFEKELAPIWEIFPPQNISVADGALGVFEKFEEQVQECYRTRLSFFEKSRGQEGIYAPLPPDTLYLSLGEVQQNLLSRAQKIPLFGLKPLPQKAVEKDHRSPTLLTAWSVGELERLKKWAEDQGRSYQVVQSLEEFEGLSPRVFGLAVLPLQQGFEESRFILQTEEDLFGQRIRTSSFQKLRADQILKELATFEPGDYVVHQDHGVGQYKGLEGVVVKGVTHDCLLLAYADGDKLYVPVENMNLISRYASKEGHVTLDKLGLPQWQARKARVKNRITVIAEHLIKLAAERAIQEGPSVQDFSTPAFETFCRKFPYVETDDQLRAIQDTLEDLGSEHPMDRLVCGDVGFGKTEVALRAAFVAVSSGYQVALIVPTTLLARQHFQTFHKRFAGTPFRVAQLSRLVSAKEALQVQKDLASGDIHIVVATHALLKKNLTFHHLGLLIVDEEQHFGVAQKEKLKNLKANIHVLTLSATPIPRTLQMALSGVREMSLITTPPLDRLAVQTFLLPFDPVVMREAILREHSRGGQVFYVCPRVEHVEKMQAKLRELVPEVRLAVAHGQMPAVQLERVMEQFEKGVFDVLLSTNIVESGIDIATANTLIVHRSDLFGLAQLYQLRGRVGRGKTQGYAYLTTPATGGISQTAQRRLEVIHSLDYLGAGFAIASHDADIRGAGNLVGEEQSGHIREVGIELYQQMLQETVEALKEDQGYKPSVTPWTPQINFPVSLRFPETYIADLNLRLGLYRRLSDLKTREDVISFEAELVDRFGPLPVDVQNLLLLMTFKILCQKAWVEKLDIGEKGAVLTFYQNTFPNPQELLGLLSNPAYPCRLSPDHKLRFLQATNTLLGLRTLQKFLEALGALCTQDLKNQSSGFEKIH